VGWYMNEIIPLIKTLGLNYTFHNDPAYWHWKVEMSYEDAMVVCEAKPQCVAIRTGHFGSPYMEFLQEVSLNMNNLHDQGGRVAVCERYTASPSPIPITSRPSTFPSPQPSWTPTTAPTEEPSLTAKTSPPSLRPLLSSHNNVLCPLGWTLNRDGTYGDDELVCGSVNDYCAPDVTQCDVSNWEEWVTITQQWMTTTDCCIEDETCNKILEV